MKQYMQVLARIYPQMTQMFTDKEKHLCSSVFICVHL